LYSTLVNTISTDYDAMAELKQMLEMLIAQKRNGEVRQQREK